VISPSLGPRVWLEPWQGRAGCLGVPLEVFFNVGPASVRSFDGAREICAACPVIADCREMTDRAERGLTRGYLYGSVGGETPTERARRRSCSGSKSNTPTEPRDETAGRSVGRAGLEPATDGL
jgi:Transcription factor WhiB